MKRMLSVFLFAAALVRPAIAEIRAESVAYPAGDVECEGYIAWDDAVEGPRPAVIVAHQWKGLGDYEKRRARELAQLGYLAFALDLYGKGVRPESSEEAGKMAGIYKGDRQLTRLRADAAFETVAAHPLAAGQPVAAIGYCFGGMVVLEMARGGAPLKGVVSFHGSLDTPNPGDAKRIKAKVLALHGADDPYVPAEHVAAFEKEMRDAGVDWQLILYGGAVHAFSDPGAGDDPSKGATYNASADRRSWQAMKAFLAEIFQTAAPQSESRRTVAPALSAGSR
jgi:dienelactone hydrolase